MYTNIYSIFFFSEINKTLLKLSKQKGYELIGRWRKACVNHVYWAVMSTPVLLKEVKLAKFQAFLYHVIKICQTRCLTSVVMELFLLPKFGCLKVVPPQSKMTNCIIL